MTKQITRQIALVMGQNLKRMRKERGWTQGELANLIGSDPRYISALERGRGIGRDLLHRLCATLEVDEDAFTKREAPKSQSDIDKLPRVTRMILDELETIPEYKQFRILADILEMKIKELEELLK